MNTNKLFINALHGCRRFCCVVVLFAVVVVAAIHEHEDATVCARSDPDEAEAPAPAC